MKHTHHIGRWIAIGATVVAIAGAGTAAATAPPSEPPVDSAVVATSEAGEAPASTCATAPASTDDATAATVAATADTTAATTADTTADTTAATSGDTTAGSTPATAGPFVQTAETEFGVILVDAECRTLYAFTQDTEGESTCFEGCATAWPPLLVEGDAVPPLAAGLDPSLFSIVQHPDGPMLKVGDWPLYYFASDAAPGDINGQGANGVWWVVAPDGTLIESVPPASGPAGTEAADSEPAVAPVATEAPAAPAATEVASTDDGY